ncbi:MAG: metallophosphoesterase [Actinobacteria bacterium]|nr:metallophosphoesterase [Actinomycetota bacterium]
MAEKYMIYFTTDIHGSETCFKKFLNAGKFYGAQMILLGGDITGKMIVPIVIESDGTRRCNYIGQSYVMHSGGEIEQVVKMIKSCGHYPYLIDHDEYKTLDNKEKLDAKFRGIMLRSVADWVQLAEDRLKGTGIRCLITPGNDDIFEVDEIIAQSDFIENPEGKVVEIDGLHELIATGYSNPTPWNTERELPEDELEQIIEEMFKKLKDPSLAVAALHAPPYDSGIDSAPQLKDFKVVTAGGQPVFIPVGSTSVRKMIEKYQPQVGLHGHIHESRGIYRLGETLCLNPGSEYTEGILDGAIIAFEKKKLVTFQLVSG